MLRAIQERKAGFSVRKVDAALGKLGEQSWAGRSSSEVEGRGSSSEDAPLSAPPPPPALRPGKTMITFLIWAPGQAHDLGLFPSFKEALFGKMSEHPTNSSFLLEPAGQAAKGSPIENPRMSEIWCPVTFAHLLQE